jgi:L-lysine exporter family protein LysE/ArgO
VQKAWFVRGAALASGLWFSGLGFGARRPGPLFARTRAWQVLDILIAIVMFTLAIRLFMQSVQG